MNQEDSIDLSPVERRAAASLAAVFAVRMLGLFLILPVFALYAEHLPDTTPVLVGLAIGAYGLTQALLQIPFGMLSDRIGRKPVILGGLLIFALGSVVAATADGIGQIILGRVLQGSGAIAAAILALAADLTREQVRTRAMSFIGISIGMAFALSLLLGPLLDAWVGVPGIFWITAGLALTGALIVAVVVPTPARVRRHRDAEAVAGQFGFVLRQPDLLRLDASVLILHMGMTALFLAFPFSLVDAGVPPHWHWLVYLPVMVLAMGAMVPFVIIAEKRRRMRTVFLGAIAALGLAQALFWGLGHHLWGLVAGLLAFFTAFNVLEATLPSWISKIAPVQAKGTAMGVYSSSQFVGAFFGGLLGGWMHHHLGVGGVYLFGLGAALVWLALAAGLSDPRYLSNELLPVGALDPREAADLEQALRRVPGVMEAVVETDEGTAYLKVNKDRLDREALHHVMANSA